MIPKVIHSIWVGGNPKSDLVKICENSWKKYCVDYTFIEWNEDNFDIDSSPLYVKEAYKKKKWAFVSDYIRLWVLYNYGGVYLDTDMELLKSIDSLLESKSFSGFEDNEFVAVGILGTIKSNPLIKKTLEHYETKSFIREDNSIDTNTIVHILTEKLKEIGLVCDGKEQLLENDFKIYSQTYFYPTDFKTGKTKMHKNTYTNHHYDSSWLTKTQKIRIKLGRFLRKNNLLKS